MATKKRETREQKKARIKQEKQVYVKECLDRAFQYEEDVLSGKIIACEWLKLGVKRGIEFRKKYYYSQEHVEKVFRFLYYININDKFKGVTRFYPIPWQAWYILNVYGLYLDNTCNKRLTRYSILWVARKSGKTGLASLLSLYGFIGEQEFASEQYTVSNTKDQASISLRYAQDYIENSPALGKRIDNLTYFLRARLKGLGTSYMKPLASDSKKLDGLNVSGALIDEAHELPDKSLFNILKTGTLARINPLIQTISTSGLDMSKPFYTDLEIGKKVLKGDIEDDRTFYAYYTIDDESEVDDPKMWIKSNPSLGYITEQKDLEADWAKAQLTKADKYNFIVKNINYYLNQPDTWIELSELKAVSEEIDYESLKGGKCYLGLDLSTVKDLSALSACIEHPETKKLHLITKLYFPNKNKKGRMRETGADFTPWIEDGYIQECEGKIIDFDDIIKDVKFFYDNFNVEAIGYDSYNSTLFIKEIDASDMMIEAIPLKQNNMVYNFPMKHFERKVLSRDIAIEKNPCVLYNYMNVVLYIDGNSNCKPMKNKSLDSIDAVMSSMMAIAVYCDKNFDALSYLMENDN